MDRELKLAIARQAVLKYQEERANSDLALILGEATPDEHKRFLDRIFELEREKFDFGNNVTPASAGEIGKDDEYVGTAI